MSNTINLESSLKTPKHVAIIMDGNGRWAKERGKPRIDGHFQGAKQIEEVLKASKDFNVEYITLYAFSSENWNRPKDEVDMLMSLLSTSLDDKKQLFIENKIRFRTIGNIAALPEFCVEKIIDLQNQTKNFKDTTLILALNYGSREELVRTVNKLAKNDSTKDITWEDIAQNLDTADIPDPDLMIRTSGEMRLSNYLLLQSAYAELYFTKTNWPDFGYDQFKEAIEEYQNRERRYGLTSEQLKDTNQ